MNPTERVVIDDDRKHLDVLTGAMTRHGLPCDGLHFDDGLRDPARVYGQVRFIYADLHLGSGLIGADPTPDYSLIGGILETGMKPRRPYAMFLWTAYPDCAAGLQDFLDERLQGVRTPVVVRPLSKEDHLTVDGDVQDEERLVEEIQQAEEKLEAFLYVPNRVEIEGILKSLFKTPTRTADVAVPGLPGLDVRLDDWLDRRPADVEMTPREMLESKDASDLFLLERMMHSVATSRAHSHPDIVLEVVCRRIETMCQRRMSLASIRGPEPHGDDRSAVLERWMDTKNALYGTGTPRQFFQTEKVDVGRLQEVSARLDAIDDGAFS